MKKGLALTAISAVEIVLILVWDLLGICDFGFHSQWVNLGLTISWEYLKLSNPGLIPSWMLMIMPFLLACFLMAFYYFFGRSQRDAETMHLFGSGIAITLVDGISRLYSRLFLSSEFLGVMVH
jgi:hypothetical protein